MPYKDKEINKKYMSNYMLRRYKKRMQEGIVFLGGKCLNCGSTEELEFDHIDPETKSFSIGKMWSVSEKRFWEEVKKCVLRCDTCHNERSAEQRRTAL